MKCSICGTELAVGEKVCHGCGNPVEEDKEAVVQANEGQEGTEAAVSESFNQPEDAAEPLKPRKKKGILMGVAAAAVVAAGALAFSFMGRKDPKEVVIHAFENIYTDDQVKPLEELFGLSEFSKNALTADVEDSISLILDDCSEAEIKQFAGSGLRVSAKSDKTNKKHSADMTVIYKDMELVSLEAYYGDETVMMAIPQLSSKVFTVDLGEGLEQRIENSPLIGPALKESGADIEGLFGYVREQMEKAESGQAATLDLDSIRTRFREGTRAYEKFKEALVVEKGEKSSFTMDGEEAACDGYKVLVSKDSMMEFLRASTDFFLNDEELKEQYLKQLEQSVKLTELMGGASLGVSAEQVYADNMEEVSEAVHEMIDFLDESLTDVKLMVYVDKKGRLAAVDGTTQMTVTDSGADAAGDPVQVDFNCRFQGGSYLTQNMTAEADLERGGNHLKLSIVKGGTYDGKRLTGDLALDVNVDGEDKTDAGISCTGTYDSDGGDYHVGMTVTEDGSMLADVSISGVVDQLEKGNSIHADIDEIKITVKNAMAQMTLGGAFSYGPLSSEATAPEGTAFDILAADEEDWEGVMMEVYGNVMQLLPQLSW